VARGLPARSLLGFTWPDPGGRATINRAELVLFVDGAASFTNGIPIAVQRVLSQPWAGEDTEVSPLLYGVNTVYADTDSVVFTITAIVDALLTEENDGFQVRATEERADTDIVRFHGPDTEVPGKEPHLRIWYTPGPGPETQP